MTWNGQYTSGRIDRSSTKAVPLLFAVPLPTVHDRLATVKRAEVRYSLLCHCTVYLDASRG